MSEELEEIKKNISTQLEALLKSKNTKEKCGLRRDKFCLADYLCQVITIVFDTDRNFDDAQKKELTKYFFRKKEKVAWTNQFRNSNLTEKYESIVDETLSFFATMITEEIDEEKKKKEKSKFIESLETLNCPQFTENINAYLRLVQVEDVKLIEDVEEVKTPEPEPEPNDKIKEDITSSIATKTTEEIIAYAVKKREDIAHAAVQNTDTLIQRAIEKIKLRKENAQNRIKKIFLKFGVNMNIVKYTINEYNKIWEGKSSIFTDKKNNVFQDDIELTKNLEKEFEDKVNTDEDSSIMAVSQANENEQIAMYRDNSKLKKDPIVTINKVLTYIENLLNKTDFQGKDKVINQINEIKNRMQESHPLRKYYPANNLQLIGYNSNTYSSSMSINLAPPKKKKTKGGKTKRKTKLRTRNKKLRSNKKRRHGKKTYKKRKTTRRK